MIDKEILEILQSNADKGERLNKIADQFRRGRSTSDIVALLNSKDTELVSIGAWILSEIPLKSYNSSAISARLHELAEHEDPTIRFHAFSALFPLVDWQEAPARALLQKLRNDPNEGVRRSAEAAAAQLSLK